MSRRGFVIAAPSSGSGKTLVTMGLLRAFADDGYDPSPFKAGPDYIDPSFHERAARRECVNLDPWAMSTDRLRSLVTGHAFTVVEGVMGLFDGSASGAGSTADLAVALRLPVVLVVDCGRQAQSVAALVHGFSTWRDDVRIAGVILNRVGSARHEAMLRRSLEGIPVHGALPRASSLHVPSRHLGLVQASDLETIEEAIEGASRLVREDCDLDALRQLAGTELSLTASVRIPPLGQRIAIARDDAFTFVYAHLLADWRAQGAEIRPFSPLGDEAPDPDCDAVFLPGGYPELHAGRLASASRFHAGLRRSVERGETVYGECGGFMVLGERLVDRDGRRHAMTGLLPIETSIAEPRRTLGYRKIEATDGWPFGIRSLRGHEFHYSRAEGPARGNVPFDVRDAEGNHLGGMGLRSGSVGGSYLHVIDVDS